MGAFLKTLVLPLLTVPIFVYLLMIFNEEFNWFFFFFFIKKLLNQDKAVVKVNFLLLITKLCT